MATRVLVINDTEEILELFRDLLEDEGYEVFLYSFAPKELLEVKRVEPDVIILDLIFGGEKLGWQLLQKLKMDRTTARIPVIICTAATTAVREIEGYLATQGVQIVPKPFDIDTLLTTLKQALTIRNNNVATTDMLPGEADDDEPHERRERRKPRPTV